jgi:hypothetical protein
MVRNEIVRFGLQMVRNEIVRFDGHIDIEVSYKIL